MENRADTLTLALWQCAYAADTSDALLRLDSTAAQARTHGADLLICPEMSLTGYLLPWDQKGYWATKVATNIAAITPFNHPLNQVIHKVAPAVATHNRIVLPSHVSGEHVVRMVVDRNGQVLATDIRTVSLFAEPHKIVDVDEAVEKLAKTLLVAAGLMPPMPSLVVPSRRPSSALTDTSLVVRPITA